MALEKKKKKILRIGLKEAEDHSFKFLNSFYMCALNSNAEKATTKHLSP